VSAIADGDAARLRAIPGVGPKTADRSCWSCATACGDWQKAREEQAHDAPGAGRTSGRSVRHDVVSALVNLGYRENQAESAVRQALAEGRGRDGQPAGGPVEDALQSVLKRSLRYLAS